MSSVFFIADAAGPRFYRSYLSRESAERAIERQEGPGCRAPLSVVEFVSVEADRQGRMPSDEELDDLSDEFHGYSGNHTRDGYLIPKFDYIGFARALLSRYGSGQPVAPDWPSINVIIAAAFGDDSANAARAQSVVTQIFAISGQPAASAEVDAWRERFPAYEYRPQDECVALKLSTPAASAEPPKLTDDEIERLACQLGATWVEDAWKIEDADLHPMVRALLYRYTSAPIAQEPVAVIGADFGLLWIGSGPIAPIVKRHGLEVGSKLYAAPVAVQSSAVDALRTLESACDALCSLRTQEQYLSMIGSGQKDALQALDDARSEARRVLAVPVAAQAQHVGGADQLPHELPESPLRADESAAEQVDAMHYRRGWNACVAAYRAALAQQPTTQDREDAERVICAARNAMDESFEAGNADCDISIPSHIVAALSLALDEYDAARAAKGSGDA